MADEEKPDYPVGFGKPPRHTRFRPGQSGNPKGRPKGAKNLATLMDKVLKEPVVISENGRRRMITKREAMLKQLVNRAAGGDPRAIQLLLGEIRQLEARQSGEAPAKLSIEDARMMLEMWEQHAQEARERMKLHELTTAAPDEAPGFVTRVQPGSDTVGESLSQDASKE